MQKHSNQFQVYWKINWLRRVVIAALVISVVLVLLPIIIQFGITHQLNKQGASKTEVQDINLNLFAGTFELKKLYMVSGKNEPAQIDLLSVNLNMLALASSKIIIDELRIKGVKLNVSRRKNGEVSINGLVLPTDDRRVEPSAENDESKPLAFGVKQLRLDETELTYQENGFTQHSNIQSATLTNLKSWDESSTAQLDLDVLLNNAPLKLSTQLSLFSEVPQIKGHVSLNKLPVASYAKFYKDHLKRLDANLSIDKDFNISLTDPVSLRLSGNVDIVDLDADYNDINQKAALIHWNGVTDLSNQGELSISGDLDIVQSSTTDTQQQYLMAEWASLNFRKLHSSKSIVQLGQLDLKELKLIEFSADKKQAPDNFVKIAHLSLQQLNMLIDNSKLSIGSVNIDKPEINLALNAEKQPEHITPLLKTLDELKPKSTDQQPEQKAESNNEATAFNITVNHIELLKPGIIHITDNSVSPIYKSTIHLNQIDIKNLSSDNSANFNLSLMQGDYTDIKVKGDGLLFDPTQQLQLDATIKQLDLPPVTPYTSEAMGYGMKSGVVDSDIQLKLDKRVIDSMINLKIDSIEVVETNTKTAEQISSASGMSIDLAVSTLKDSKNIIELKLPVKGNIDEPDFDLSLIINNAMGKAMKSATLSYLKYALQPFGSLISLIELAKAAADHISLPPILFKTNSLEIMDQQQELIDKILKILKDRPGVKIKACGVSALEDQLAIQQALIEVEKAKLEKLRLEAAKQATGKQAESKKIVENITIDPESVQQKMKELADSRAAKVKSYLLEEAKLESKRILNCLSTTKTEKDSKPSVEMQI